MAWPVYIPDTVSVPTHAALAAIQRFSQILGRSAPLDQIDVALKEGARAKAELTKAMRHLRQERSTAKQALVAEQKAVAKYKREEKRLASKLAQATAIPAEQYQAAA